MVVVMVMHELAAKLAGSSSSSLLTVLAGGGLLCGELGGVGVLLRLAIEGGVGERRRVGVGRAGDHVGRGVVDSDGEALVGCPDGADCRQVGGAGLAVGCGQLGWLLASRHVAMAR